MRRCHLGAQVEKLAAVVLVMLLLASPFAVQAETDGRYTEHAPADRAYAEPAASDFVPSDAQAPGALHVRMESPGVSSTPAFQFVDATEGALPDDLESLPEGSHGTILADFDGDGDLDLLRGATIHFNQGVGLFGDPLQLPVSSTDHVVGAAAGDIDNDGDLDIVLGQRDKGLSVFHQTHSGFVKMNGPGTPAPGGFVFTPILADFNNDGFLDIYVCQGGSSKIANNTNHLYLNRGDGTFTDFTSESRAGLSNSSPWAIAMDYDGDGDLDLFVPGIAPYPQSFLMENDGTARFTNVTDEVGLTAPNSTRMQADFGDFDNDGDFDLAVTYHESRFALYANRGDGVFEDATNAVGLSDADPAVYRPSFVDLNNDGFLDLVLFNRSSSPPERSYVYLNDSGLSFTDVSEEMSGSDLIGYEGQCWGDIDGDGDLDNFGLARPDLQRLSRLEIASPNNHLLVQTVGVISNRDGIGAQLTAEVGGRTLTRQVGGKIADSLEVEFGLGAATQVDRFTIRWPSGIVQALDNVAANQRITVIETVQFTASIVPALPRTMDDLHCAVDAEQSLAPGDLAYRWFRNGTLLTEPKNVNNVILPVDGPSLSRWFTAKNETYYCSVDFDTGSGLMTVNTLPVTIQNTPPTAPVVEIRPATPRAGQDLGINILVYSQDADNDPIKYAIRWYESENGGLTWVHKVELDDNPFISGSVYIEEGDLWRVEVIPYEDTGGFFAKSGDALAASVVGDIGWDLVYIGENARPILTITNPGAGGALAEPAVTIRWTAQDSDGDPIAVDLYYDEDGVKGGEILIAEGLPAEGDLSWTPPLTALPTGLDQNGDLYLDHRDLFHMAAGWQASPTGGVHIFGRARDSKGAIGEAFSPGPAFAADSALLTAESLMAARERWHQRR